MSLGAAMKRQRVVVHLRYAHDELENKALEIARVNEELTEYSTAVFHDVRAPIRAIHNYVDFLREDLRETLEDEQGEYLDGIAGACSDADRLVADLLEFAQIRLRQENNEKIAVGDLLSSIRSELDLPDTARIVLSENWPTISCPRTLMRQIFQNLISNAVKFNTSSSKEVEISRRAVGESAYEFCVKDNGIGIESRYPEQIFGIFQRLHTPKEFEGTGVGLAIVKKAVWKLSGSVRVESTPGENELFHCDYSLQTGGGLVWE